MAIFYCGRIDMTSLAVKISELGIFCSNVLFLSLIIRSFEKSFLARPWKWLQALLAAPKLYLLLVNVRNSLFQISIKAAAEISSPTKEASGWT
jgi:hypothetical protein